MRRTPIHCLRPCKRDMPLPIACSSGCRVRFGGSLFNTLSRAAPPTAGRTKDRPMVCKLFQLRKGIHGGKGFMKGTASLLKSLALGIALVALFAAGQKTARADEVTISGSTTGSVTGVPQLTFTGN